FVSPTGLWASTPPERRATVGRWFAGIAGLTFTSMSVGGITRLTESGLSITRWKPSSGSLPPLTEAQWSEAYERYRQTPEFRFVHSHMSLEDFKGIFFWEYVHRQLGRLIGVAIVIPAIVFSTKRWLVGVGRQRAFLLAGLVG